MSSGVTVCLIGTTGRNLPCFGEKINSDGRAGEFQGFEVQQSFVTANKLQLSRLKYRQRAHVAEHLAIAQQYRVTNDIQRRFYQTLALNQAYSEREKVE